MPTSRTSSHRGGPIHPAGSALVLAETPSTFLEALPGLALRFGARLRVQPLTVDPGKGLPTYPVLRAMSFDGQSRLVMLPGWEDERRAFPMTPERVEEILDQAAERSLDVADPDDLFGLDTGTVRGVMVTRLMATAAQMKKPARDLFAGIGDLFHLTLQYVDTGRGMPLPVLRLYGAKGGEPWMFFFPSYWGSRVHRSERITDLEVEPLLEKVVAEGALEVALRGV